MRYLPHTDAEIREMLSRIGIDSIDALFASIPEANRLGRPLDLEPALDEVRLTKHLSSLADANDAARALSFLGGGIYDHHVPPAMDQLLMRSEFYTAYTPYQAEVVAGHAAEHLRVPDHGLSSSSGSMSPTPPCTTGRARPPKRC